MEITNDKQFKLFIGSCKSSYCVITYNDPNKKYLFMLSNTIFK